MASGFVAVLTCELHFPDAHSLKEKRHYLRSAKAQLQRRVGASVAEVDHHDLWQRAVLAAVTVSADRVQAEKVLQSVEHETASLLGPALAGVTVEWF